MANKISQLQDKIKKVKNTLEILEKQLKEESDNSEWIQIPEKGVEIQKSIHHKGDSYDALVKEFGKETLEKNLPTYELLQWLRNNDKYCKMLGLVDTWEFVVQPDNISKKNGYVARFYAGSDCAGLNCGRDSDYSYSSLGVTFVRKKVEK